MSRWMGVRIQPGEGGGRSPREVESRCFLWGSSAYFWLTVSWRSCFLPVQEAREVTDNMLIRNKVRTSLQLSKLPGFDKCKKAKEKQFQTIRLGKLLDDMKLVAEYV